MADIALVLPPPKGRPDEKLLIADKDQLYIIFTAAFNWQPSDKKYNCFNGDLLPPYNYPGPATPGLPFIAFGPFTPVNAGEVTFDDDTTKIKSKRGVLVGTPHTITVG
ncbi:MAG: hypothetical protein ABSE46_16340 [Terracidiphilus sp.]|jgi:hypothetical protein